MGTSVSPFNYPPIETSASSTHIEQLSRQSRSAQHLSKTSIYEHFRLTSGNWQSSRTNVSTMATWKSSRLWMLTRGGVGWGWGGGGPGQSVLERRAAWTWLHPKQINNHFVYSENRITLQTDSCVLSLLSPPGACICAILKQSSLALGQYAEATLHQFAWMT